MTSKKRIITVLLLVAVITTAATTITPLTLFSPITHALQQQAQQTQPQQEPPSQPQGSPQIILEPSPQQSQSPQPQQQPPVQQPQQQSPQPQPQPQQQQQQQPDNRCKETGDYLTTFHCGRVQKLNNGTTIRSFTLIAEEDKQIPITYNLSDSEAANTPPSSSDDNNNGDSGDSGSSSNSNNNDDDANKTAPIMFPAWTFNGTIPGPTIRATEGDIVKITLINSNTSKHAHSIHLHSIHSGAMDGTIMSGASGSIAPGDNFTYSFKAVPAGVYPYHCHVSPIENHINHGLYGVFIIDPKNPRTPMTEMVMLMNGYDLNMETEDRPSFVMPTPTQASDMIAGKESTMVEGEERDNEIYSVNGKAFEYLQHPIRVQTNHPIRIYLVNMLEFDLINSFHLHGSMFKYYPAGTESSAPYNTDVVAMGQGDRGIIETYFPHPGMYMFHAHVTEFSEKGWMGAFMAMDKAPPLSPSLQSKLLPTPAPGTTQIVAS